MVLALIWVEIFFLCEYIVFAFVVRKINLLVLAIFLALPLSGYFGILYNSSNLLRCFACLALMQALLWTVLTVLIILVLLLTEWSDDSLHQDAEHVVMLIFFS